MNVKGGCSSESQETSETEKGEKHMEKDRKLTNAAEKINDPRTNPEANPCRGVDMCPGTFFLALHR